MLPADCRRVKIAMDDVTATSGPAAACGVALRSLWGRAPRSVESKGLMGRGRLSKIVTRGPLTHVLEDAHHHSRLGAGIHPPQKQNDHILGPCCRGGDLLPATPVPPHLMSPLGTLPMPASFLRTGIETGPLGFARDHQECARVACPCPARRLADQALWATAAGMPQEPSG
ncbi:unnamed protein product [Gadus morhua 'NCC']